MRLLEADGVDLDAFLPDKIITLCSSIYSKFNEPKTVNPEKPHLEKYEYLRSHLEAHHNLGEAPYLALLPRPTGGWKAFRRNIILASNIAEVNQMDIDQQQAEERYFTDHVSNEDDHIDLVEEDADWSKRGAEPDEEYEP